MHVAGTSESNNDGHDDEKEHAQHIKHDDLIVLRHINSDVVLRVSIYRNAYLLILIIKY